MKAKVDELKALPYITSVVEDYRTHEGPDARIFPGTKYTKWNGDNYGPLTIPKEGMKIVINDSTLFTYGRTIKDYDLNKDVKIEGDKLLIDGKEVTEYTFKQNYYFMMGDNRDNSADSRYFGFVDRKEILGRATAIVISLDLQHYYQPRWPRFFTKLE